MNRRDLKLVLILVPLALLAGVGSMLVLYRLLRPASSALRFNGFNRVEIPSAPDLKFGTQPFSVSLWLRTTTARKNLTFVSKRADALGDGWGLFGQGENQFLFYAAGCSSPMSSSQNYRDGRWHHLAAVRQNSRVDLFYDSQLVGTGPESCNFLDDHPILIGMDGVRGEHFEGELADVRIYNRALSADEVAVEWNNGNGNTQPVPGLVGGFRFDEGAGDVARDFSGAGHDGKCVNNPVRTRERR